MANNHRTAPTAPGPTMQQSLTEQQQDAKDLIIQQLTEQLAVLTGKVEGIERGQEKAPTFAAELRKLDELDGYCLFRYNPGADPERHVSKSILRLPIEVDGPVPKEGGAPEKLVDYIALVPDIQAIPRAQAEQLLDSKFESVRQLKAVGILELWDESWDIALMEPSKAIQTIALTNRSNQLLATWAKRYHDLDDVVKRRLVQKQEELNARAMDGPKTLFGTSIT